MINVECKEVSPELPKMSLETLKTLTLYSIKPSYGSETHIGYVHIDKKAFIILCGGSSRFLRYNPISSYEISTAKELKGKIIVELE